MELGRLGEGKRFAMLVHETFWGRERFVDDLEMHGRSYTKHPCKSKGNGEVIVLARRFHEKKMKFCRFHFLNPAGQVFLDPSTEN